MKCRHCAAELSLNFVDLGNAPPSNAYLTVDKLNAPEKWFPLKVKVCSSCWLVQIEDYPDSAELFSADYAYFSSYSSTWLAHAQRFVKDMRERFNLDAASRVVEVAANDGYLLQYVKAAGIPCLGIEPTKSTASAARQKGIDIVEGFFGVRLARKLSDEGKQADLTAANNVLAHVPDINDFVSGFAVLLKPDGVAIFEFPHLLQLVAQNQFDTVYHEHFSYLSLTAVNRIFEKNGLFIFDAAELSTHGGSLRVFACRADSKRCKQSERVLEILSREKSAGMTTVEYYAGFQGKTDKVKNDFLVFLIDAWKRGKKVVGYGAAAKGNTLLNYAGVRFDLLSFVVDKSPAKQGKYLPGSRIPIVDESRIRTFRPDCVVILPWNLKEEIMAQLSYIRDWGGKFVTAVPRLKELG
ncbi:MAG: class I SAM-dependent methyltransferase [Candidatus Omnitrophica bacterium]|nr:class I SAM-dependent methyltransferase [Candidatus Omnitrophota bacterium]